MSDADSDMLGHCQQSTDYRKNKFYTKEPIRNLRNTRQRETRFLIYDEEFQNKLKSFRENFGRMKSKHRKTLEDISLKIVTLERRLNNAKAARDAYIDFLQMKYPLWKPVLSSYAGPPRTDVVIEDKTQEPLNAIWEAHMNRKTPQDVSLTDPMNSYAQTREQVRELRNQMRELQARVSQPLYYNGPRMFPQHYPSEHYISNTRSMMQNMNLNDSHIPRPHHNLFSSDQLTAQYAQQRDHLLQEVNRLQNAYDAVKNGTQETPSTPKTEIVAQEPAVTEPPNFKPVEPAHQEIVQERRIVFNTEPSVQPEPVMKPSTTLEKRSSIESNQQDRKSSQVMNILNNKNETSDSEDDIEKQNVTTKNMKSSGLQSVIQQSKSKTTTNSGSLSMYLKKIADNDSSSSEDIFSPVKKMGGIDSDSDFFG